MNSRGRHLDDPIVEGAPRLAVPDQDRELLAELLAEMLVAALLPDEPGR